MKISDAAKASGLSAKAIRYYEAQGLIKSHRLDNGYRDYSPSEIKALSFIQHARELGFNLDACRDLLTLFHNPRRASASVKAVAQKRLSEIQVQRQRLDAMERILDELINKCPGNDSPDCAILDELSR